MRYKVLSTRRLTKVQREAFENEGVEVDDIDFIETEILPIKNVPEGDYYIVTSQKAVESLKENECFEKLRGKKFLCVGEKTSAKLRAEGVDVVEVMPYAEELAEVIEERYFGEGSFVFFCGNVHSDVLPRMFERLGMKYWEKDVYKVFKKPKEMSKRYDCVLVFSPLGVDSFMESNESGGVRFFSIGKSTASRLSEYGRESYVSEKQSVEGVIEVCLRYLKGVIK